MQRQYHMQTNGQELQVDDLNLLAETSPLVDDYVIGELFRPGSMMATAEVAKGIMPLNVDYGGVVQGDLDPMASTLGQVSPTTGGFNVFPFRAFIGSRSFTNDYKGYRDGRSQVWVGTGTQGRQKVTPANGDPTNARWDLIYAVVTPDVNDAGVVRYVRNPITQVVTSPTVSVSKQTSVTVSIVSGTPSSSPALPPLPTDAGGNYFIPIAYVRIPAGFNSSSTPVVTDIMHAYDPLRLSAGATGGAMARPASSLNTIGQSLTTGRIATWGSTGTRPTFFIPRSARGAQTLIVAVDANDPSSANWSHTNGSIIDDSQDWSKCLFTWTAMVVSAASFARCIPFQLPFPTSPTSAQLFTWDNYADTFNGTGSPGENSPQINGVGQSFFDDTSLDITGTSGGTSTNGASFSLGSGGGRIATLNDQTGLAGATWMCIYVDYSDGKIKFRHGGSDPQAVVVMMITAYQIPNNF